MKKNKCIYCSDSNEGCMECLNNTICLKCNEGYYLYYDQVIDSISY